MTSLPALVRIGTKRAFAASALVALSMAALTWSAPAEARIKCVNGNQVVKGSLIATPYCQDELVAKVAREYGFKVSANKVRANPLYKRNICQFVGRDIRISQACIDANSVGRRAF